MTTLEYIIGGLLLILAVALVWLIGAQQSKRRSGLSGSIAGQGASESYLSRNKIASRESSYKKITLIVAIVFVVLVLALYTIGSVDPKDETSNATPSDIVSAVESSVAASSTADSSTVDSSVAESSAVDSSVVESSAVDSSVAESSVVESSVADSSAE